MQVALDDVSGKQLWNTYMIRGSARGHVSLGAAVWPTPTMIESVVSRVSIGHNHRTLQLKLTGSLELRSATTVGTTSYGKGRRNIKFAATAAFMARY
jgi:hypothetical protein